MRAGKRGKRGQLTRRIHTRLTQEKYEELSRMLQQSRSQKSLSELVRDILEDKKIILHTYDATLDKVMEELSAIHKELHAIGININQVTRYFHNSKEPEAKLFNALEVSRLYQQADEKVTRLLEAVAKLSEKWLPE